MLRVRNLFQCTKGLAFSRMQRELAYALGVTFSQQCWVKISIPYERAINVQSDLAKFCGLVALSTGSVKVTGCP